MYQWRKFQFFEEKAPGPSIAEELKENVECCSSGRGRMVVGSTDGMVHVLDRGLKLNYSFQAHTSSVRFIQQLKVHLIYCFSIASFRDCVRKRYGKLSVLTDPCPSAEVRVKFGASIVGMCDDTAWSELQGRSHQPWRTKEYLISCNCILQADYSLLEVILSMLANDNVLSTKKASLLNATLSSLSQQGEGTSIVGHEDPLEGCIVATNQTSDTIKVHCQPHIHGLEVFKGGTLVSTKCRGRASRLEQSVKATSEVAGATSCRGTHRSQARRRTGDAKANHGGPSGGVKRSDCNNSVGKLRFEAPFVDAGL
eukprot:Gb_07922 [translate_table: standard]